jgi:nitrite reductase/ring-hydroxylating ferredoxin subunit
VIELDLRAGNVFEAGGLTYFVAESRPGHVVVLPDACPHRGGPLRLGSYDPAACVLECPWHGTRFPLARLLAKALPCVRSGHRLRACVPADEPARVTFRRQSAALRALY